MALRALRVGVLDQSRVISGHTPGQVREQLLALVEQYAADELMVITITGDYESRKQSYRLLAKALELPN